MYIHDQEEFATDDETLNEVDDTLEEVDDVSQSAEDEPEAEDVDQTETDEGEAADTDPADKSKITFTAEQQAILNREIAKARYEGMRKAQEQSQTPAVQPELPPVPELPSDPFADDYQEQMEAYAAALAERKVAEAQTQTQTQYEQQQRASALQAKEQACVENAQKAGVNVNTLNAAVQTVNAYGGVGMELSETILGMENGHEIILALADNPAHVEKLRSLDPVGAGMYLAKMSTSKPAPKKSNAPKPIKKAKGGPPKNTHPLLEGAVYS